MFLTPEKNGEPLYLTESVPSPTTTADCKQTYVCVCIYPCVLYTTI